MATSIPISSEDIQKYQASQGGGQPQPSIQPQPKSGFQASDLIPAAGGILGNIAGGIGGAVAGEAIDPLGGGIPGAWAGGTAGGAAGQSLGEWVKELVTNQHTNPGEIAKQGVIGGAFGAIPGGEEALGAKVGLEGLGKEATETAAKGLTEQAGKLSLKTGLLKGGIRAATGAVAGGVAQGVSEIGSKDDLGTAIKKTGEAAGITGLINPVAGQLLDMGTSALKYLGQQIPTDIVDYAIKKPTEAAQAIFKTVQGMLVGQDNVDYAVSKGILPTGTITQSGKGITATGLALTGDQVKTSLDKASIIAKNVEGNLQKELSNAGTVAYKDVSNMIQDAGNRITDSFKANKIVSQLQTVLNDGASKAGGEISTDSQIPLSIVNDIKRTVGNFIKTDGVPGVYSQFRQFVEDNAGDNALKIKALNQEAQKLMNIKGDLSFWKGVSSGQANGKILPEEYSAQGITKAVNEAGNKVPKSLQSLIAGLATGGYMAIGGAIKGVEGAAVGVGAAFGMRNTIQKFTDAALESPEAKLKVSSILSGMYKIAAPEDKAIILEGLRQLGVRLPVIGLSQK